MKPFAFFITIAALGALALLLPYAPAMAQNPTAVPGRAVTDDEVNAVARQMFCPVCENTPLDVCPTQACAEWRELIRQKLADGWSEAQIKEYFVERFGDRVLATPPARGLNWLVYLLPPVIIAVGIFLVYQALKSWRSQAKAHSAGAAALDTSDDEYVKRLEEELRKQQ